MTLGRAGPAVAALILAFAASAHAAPPGAQLATACAACHQPIGSSGAIPTVQGVAAGRIEQALADYRTGARKNLVMQGVARALSAEDSAAVARYLATQRPGP